MVIRIGKKIIGQICSKGQRVTQSWSLWRNKQFLATQGRGPETCRPIFVIGPPRCGSTLLYQAMTHYFKFSFFTNEMMNNPYAVPLYVHKHTSSVEYQSDFTSKHGITIGESAPHEGWPFWRRFYPRDIHDYIADSQFLTEEKEVEIQNTISFIINFYKRPFLAKNMEIGLRLKSIKKIFPNAVYIVMKRNPKAIASSLLAARLKTHGSKSDWWSIRPATYDQLKNTSVSNQVICQISDIYKTICKDSLGLNVIDLSYEELCASPTDALDGIADKLLKMGVKLSRTSNRLPPNFFINEEFIFSEKEEHEIDILLRDDHFLANYMSK